MLQTKEAQGDKELAKLARQQGMNTDIRKGIFNVLMSSEVRIRFRLAAGGCVLD